MLITLIAPEIMVRMTLVDWISARFSNQEMEMLALQDEVEWSVTHGFLADMGGFVVCF